MTTTLPRPERTAHTPTTAGRRRRRGWIAAGVVVLVLLAAAAWIVRRQLDDRTRDYLGTDGWPAVGQGAYVIDDRTPRASERQEPAPIASLAKVMTALVVLKHRPLAPGASGPVLRVTGADVVDTERRRARDESVVPVRFDEQLTERDALMALMLPSANNVAIMLARYTSGSVPAFVAEMNRTAHALGMSRTTYTDPSGFDEGTVSTAVDQLTLARAAAHDDTLTEIVGTRSYRLPVAGTVHNTDSLLGSGGFVGTKTGSDDAAGGCFMFRAYRSIDGFNVQIIGVVMGQQGHHLLTAGLYSARQLVDRVAPEPAHP
jgi:D-alanyl-D-alanine carboxypeptidase (penicillin-binding protein 5/6)